MPQELGDNDEMAYTNYEQWRDTSGKEVLLNAAWQPLRVKFNYDALSGYSEYNFIKNSLMEPIKTLFGYLLQIKRNPNGVKSSKQKCYKA